MDGLTGGTDEGREKGREGRGVKGVPLCCSRIRLHVKNFLLNRGPCLPFALLRHSPQFLQLKELNLPGRERKVVKKVRSCEVGLLGVVRGGSEVEPTRGQYHLAELELVLPLAFIPFTLFPLAVSLLLQRLKDSLLQFPRVVRQVGNTDVQPPH